VIVRAGTGWQTTLADLSLILFLVAAAGASRPPPPRAEPPLPPIPTLGQPVAIWRAAPDGPGLAQWLQTQPGDPRLRLTLVAGPEGLARVLVLAREAGRPARLVFEPGLGRDPFATLTYDQPAQVARDLRQRSD
jgi:hypothetical protein